MRLLRKILPAIATASFAIALSASQGAAQTTSAQFAKDANSYTGPGTHYDMSLSHTQGDTASVERCSNRWCLLADSQSWISIDALSFGQHARAILTGPHFELGRENTGTVCFFDGHAYSGDSFCMDSGHVINDLDLFGWDNRISSVTVDEGTSAHLCRDIKLASHCVRIDQNISSLDWLSNDAASSIQVLTPGG